MPHRFEDLPRRVFLDSSTLQTLHNYGEFVYDGGSLGESDRIRRDPRGVEKLNALRLIAQMGQRASFEFALSARSLDEVEGKRDSAYLQWAYEVRDHWFACLADGRESCRDPRRIADFESKSIDYLGEGDRLLLRDAVSLGCDTFLTMENRVAEECAAHRTAARNSCGKSH